MLSIPATGYKWHQSGGRGHHLVIFSTPIDAVESSFENVKFKCSLPTWTPTHGSIKNWETISLDESRVGLYIPKFWWNIFFAWLPQKRKTKLFSMEIEVKTPVRQ